MAAAYTQFGPPDHKERTAAAETWQYNYLEAYQSRVTIEFPPDRRWPRESRGRRNPNSRAAVKTLSPLWEVTHSSNPPSASTAWNNS